MGRYVWLILILSNCPSLGGLPTPCTCLAQQDQESGAETPGQSADSTHLSDQVQENISRLRQLTVKLSAATRGSGMTPDSPSSTADSRPPDRRPDRPPDRRPDRPDRRPDRRPDHLADAPPGSSSTDPVSKLLEWQETRQRESAQKIEELNDRIRRIMAQQTMRQLEAETQPTNTSAPPTAAAGSQPATNNQPSTGREPMPEPEADEAVSGLESVENHSGISDMDAQQILARPVDQLALADSLYRSQDFEFAHDLYVKLLESPSMTAHRLWIEYQLAACLRQLNRPQDAAAHLRNIVGSDEEHELVAFAKWWLEQLENRQTLEHGHQQLELLIKELKKEIQ